MNPKKHQDTLDLINNRRTIRLYDNTPIAEKEVKIIINAAMRAPTAGNLMMYSILEIKDQKIKDKLAVTCDNQPFIATTPLVLIFLADMQRWWDCFKIFKTDEFCRNKGIDFETPKESDLFLACCDALIAAQNAVIAAEALGMGSCYIGDIMENIETHRKLLNLPRWVFPIAMLCIGYPKMDKNQNKVPLSSRFPEKHIHFVDQYRRLDSEDFTEMLRTVEGRYDRIKADNTAQKAYFAKMGAEFTKEMRRSVKVALEDWTKESTDEENKDRN